jgi:hypothetical protein
MRGWRIAAVTIAVTGITAGLGLAWTSLTSGHVLILLVIAGPCILACLFWLLFSDGSRDRTVTEPTEASDWESRLRPQFPREDRTEIDLKRQTEGGET